MIGSTRRVLLATALAACMLLVLGTSVAAAANRFVNSATGVDGVNTCLVQANPCRTIVRAHTVAQPGDVIVLAAGTYVERPTITKAVTIQGAGQANTTINAAASAGSL